MPQNHLYTIIVAITEIDLYSITLIDTTNVASSTEGGSIQTSEQCSRLLKQSSSKSPVDYCTMQEKRGQRL